MTPQSGHLELVTAEPKTLRVVSKDMEPGPDTLSRSAADLARNLAWVPGQQESRNFRDRCEALHRAFRPLLASLERREAKPLPEDLLPLR